MRDIATLLEALPYIREFHGQTVVIGLNTAGPAADFSVFDDLLNGLEWQPSP